MGRSVTGSRVFGLTSWHITFFSLSLSLSPSFFPFYLSKEIWEDTGREPLNVSVQWNGWDTFALFFLRQPQMIFWWTRFTRLYGSQFCRRTAWAYGRTNPPSLRVVYTAIHYVADQPPTMPSVYTALYVDTIWMFESRARFSPCMERIKRGRRGRLAPRSKPKLNL